MLWTRHLPGTERSALAFNLIDKSISICIPFTKSTLWRKVKSHLDEKCKNKKHL